jgi:hypothetical protein
MHVCKDHHSSHLLGALVPQLPIFCVPGLAAAPAALPPECAAPQEQTCYLGPVLVLVEQAGRCHHQKMC